jgi:hypothetical protein
VRIHAFADGGSWRPLYFIPWDSSVKQTPEEEDLCKRILFERALSSAISRVGRVREPGEVNLPLDGILEDATFNLVKLWRNRRDITHVLSTIRRFLENAIRKGSPHLRFQWDGATRSLKISIASREEAEVLRRALEEGKPVEWLGSLEAKQPSLFDQDGVE